MSDPDWYKPHRPPTPPRQPQPVDDVTIELALSHDGLVLIFKAAPLQTTMTIPVPSARGLRDIAAAFTTLAEKLEK